MSTDILALLITLAILSQLAVAFTVWLRRRDAGDNVPIPEQGVDQVPQAGVTAGRNKDKAWVGFKPFRVVRRVYENSSRDICSFYIVPGVPMDLPDFIPGQFLTFKFDLQNGDGEIKRALRSYSLSDHPQSDAYRISVKRKPDGLVSNHLHDSIQVGDTLMVKAPSGQFHLIEEPSLPIVLIAGGIGITPMLSILLSLLNRGSEREIWLFYGVRNGGDVIMHDQLLSLADYHAQFHLHLCYSRPDERDRPGIDYQHSGRVDIHLLQSELRLARYQFYVCGPGAMVESIVPGLEYIGILVEDIHYEAFGPATLKRKKASVRKIDEHWKVTFTRSGRSVEWDGHHDSLLNMAESEGVEVESGCRAGSCGGCMSRIENGEVEYFQEPLVDVEEGQCLLCISRPKSDLELAV